LLELVIDYKDHLELFSGGIALELAPESEVLSGPLAIADLDPSRNQQQTLYTQRVLLARPLFSPTGMLIEGLHNGANGVELLNEQSILYYDGEAHRTVLKRLEFDDTNPHFSVTRSPGDSDTLRAVLSLWDRSPQIFLNKFPGSIPAAFTIIDDADGENRDKLLAAYYGVSDPNDPEFGRGGLLGNGLRTTRTIFGVSRLYDVWDRLYADGVEIGFHTYTGNADSATVTRRNLEVLVRRYGIRNWVDHSVPGNPEDLNYRGSWPTEDNPFYMLDVLEELGFDYAWVEYNMHFGFDAFGDRKELPHHSEALDDPNVPGSILVYGRTAGSLFTNHWRSFDQIVTESALEELVLRGGLTLIYTHTCVTHNVDGDVGYLIQTENGWRIKEEAEAIFGMISERVANGDLWVAPASEIFDRLVMADSISIREVTDRQATDHPLWRITNTATSPFEALGIRVTRTDSLWIDGVLAFPTREGWVEIERLDPGETITLTTTRGRPVDFQVSASPNPFRGSTRIALNLPYEGRLSVGVFDVQGRRVRDLWTQNLGTGTYYFDWDGTNSQGNRVSSGRYWIMLSGPGQSRSIGVLMLKR
jgi:hypothetical protein